MIVDQRLQIFSDNLITTILNKKWSKLFHINQAFSWLFWGNINSNAASTQEIISDFLFFQAKIHTSTIIHVLATQHIKIILHAWSNARHYDLLDGKHRYNFQLNPSKQRSPSAHYTGWSILAQHACRAYRTLEYFTGCPHAGERCREKCTGKGKKSNKPQKFGGDRYFKKVEKSELNMTGLHFVHACATSSAKEQNNSYHDSTKRQITSCAACVFMSVPKLKNLRAQDEKICGTDMRKESENSLCSVKSQVEHSPYPGSMN